MEIFIYSFFLTVAVFLFGGIIGNYIVNKFKETL